MNLNTIENSYYARINEHKNMILQLIGGLSAINLPKLEKSQNFCLSTTNNWSEGIDHTFYSDCWMCKIINRMEYKSPLNDVLIIVEKIVLLPKILSNDMQTHWL